jgi:hypothetical protein
MTVRLVATVTCDGCGAELTVDESAVHARNALMVARTKGWKTYLGGPEQDLCPACKDRREHPAKQLTLG